MIIKLSFLLLFCSGLYVSSKDDSIQKKDCNITLDISNIRNTDGIMHFFVFSYKNQYPDNPWQHYSLDKSQVVNNRMLVNLKGLEQGKYAFSLLDDENANEDLDFFFGLPTEGYGFSNDVKPFLSMPEYEDLLIDVEDNYKRIKINLQYIL